MAGLKSMAGEDMTRYLMAIHHPDDYDAVLKDEAMCRDIDALAAFRFKGSMLSFLLEVHP